MEEEQKSEQQAQLNEDKPIEPQHEQLPAFEIGNVTVVVTE